MKILLLSDYFPPEKLDGAGNAAYRLAKEFLRRGHSVFVATSTQNKKNEGESTHEGMRIFKIYSDYDLRFRSYTSLKNFPVLNKIEKILRETKSDIVHAHNIHMYLSYYSLKLAKKYSKAVFLTAHDLMAVHYGKFKNFFGKDCLSVNCPYDYKIKFSDLLETAGKKYNPFRNMFIRYYLKHADKIFTISDGQKKVLAANDVLNTETIHNGIDVRGRSVNESDAESFRSTHSLGGRKVIFFAGRISESKGSLAILAALKIIKKTIPNVVLAVAGGFGPGTKEMAEHAKMEGLEECLRFLGLLGEGEMKTAYACADVCVTPSIYFDPFNLTNIEAMAAKKPVVGTCFGGTPEIVIDGETGFIVNPLNAGMFAEKVIKLLLDPVLTGKMGQAGYERVREKFSLEVAAEKHLYFFEKAWRM